MKSVCFIFPHEAGGPTGGYKVVYEYANRLARDGVEVHVAYSGSVFWSRKSLYHKLTNVARYVQKRVRGFSSRGWFALDERVHEHLTWSMCYRHMPKCDVYVATSPYTAWYLNEYPIDNRRKHYLIQDQEDWGPGLRAILADTYRMPLRKIVISGWLQRMLETEYGESSVLVTNGFDFERFRCVVDPEERDPFTVSMLYHTMDRKDCATGMKALRMAHQREPRLRVLMFGTPEMPQGLPEWIEYHRQPSDAEHLDINNRAAIFLGTSKQEGWGLTVGEAMICGQAVVCTDNPGYLEMAVDGRNAVVVPVGDADAMADAIVALMHDDERRCRLASQARKDIARFTWDESYERLKQNLGV